MRRLYPSLTELLIIWLILNGELERCLVNVHDCTGTVNHSGRKTTISGSNVSLKLTNEANMTRLLKVQKRRGLCNYSRNAVFRKVVIYSNKGK